MTGFTYKSYSFQNKDPIIDEIRTLVQDSGASHKWIEEESGVTAVTLRAWFYGATKKPQAATINAVARSLGYKLGFVQVSTQTQPVKFDPPMSQRVASVRHIVQMARYKKGARK